MEESTQPSLLARITVAGSGQVFVVERFPVLIGRSDDCEVRLDEPAGQATLSRRHARLSLGSGRLRLEDLSTNGTRVGGRLINPGELRPLSDREEVCLGAQLKIVVETLRPGQPPVAEPPPLSPALAAADAGLRLHSLGHFQAYWADQPIAEAAWGTRKPILLLTYLAWQGERPVPIERVCSELWPDNAQGGRQALQSTLARIRRGLKPMEPVLLERGAYRLNPELNTYLDAAVLLQAARQTEGRSAALREVRSLYRGPFLEGFSEDWVALRRQDLEQQYLRCMGELCQQLHSQQAWVEAAELCREVLEVESCWEPGHQGLIKGMLELGQRDEAVRHYHRYVETMKAQLSLPPSPEMLRLYYTLLDCP